MKDCLEFYNVKTGGLITAVESSILPRNGDLISIEKKTWKVVRVTFAVDYSASSFQTRAMVASVVLRLYPGEEKHS